MARSFRRRHAAHPIADLNVTNLIDLGFMLLVIFMIATPLITQEQKIPVDLPLESASAQRTPDPRERREFITVQADGLVLLGGRPVSLSELAAELARFASEPKQPVIDLRIDKRATGQHFVSVLDELKKHHLTRLSINTQVAR